MHLITSYMILGGGLFFAAVAVTLALRLLRVDRLEGNKSAARAKSLQDAIMGRVQIQDDLLPDARMRGGIVYNKKKKRLEISGRLSEDSFDRVFR